MSARKTWTSWSISSPRCYLPDLETTALDPLRADIVGWAISWEPHKGYYIAVRGPAGQAVLDPQTVVESLRPILEHPAVEVTNQNIKYDMLVLRRAGISLRGIGNDPMVGSYLLDAGARSHGLDELARRHLRHEMIPITQLIGKGGLFPESGPMKIDIALAAEYAVEDAEVAWELAGRIERELRSRGIMGLVLDARTAAHRSARGDAGQRDSVSMPRAPARTERAPSKSG